MKKVIACLMTICLLVQLPFGTGTSYAAETAGSKIADSASEVGNPEKISPSKSQLEVQIKSFYDFADGKSFTVTLEGKGDQIAVLKKEADRSYLFGAVTFEELETGNYALTVKSDQYAVYSQEIEIASDGLDYRVELFTSYNDVKYYLEREGGNGKHPGVLSIGNVDASKGELNEEDAEAVIRAFGSRGEGLPEDLNCDGAVDLVDLQYLAENLGKTPLVSDLFASVITEKIDVAGAEGTKLEIEGGTDLRDAIFGQNDMAVKLQPSQEGAISEENPVELSLTIADENSAGVPMEAIVIKSPEGTDTAPQAGTVRIEYEENGETKFIDYYFGTAGGQDFVPVGTVGVPGIGTGETGSAETDEDGNIVVDLGKQVAVKKVTIRVTETSGDGSLAQISQVEFLNDMEDRIPAPQLSVPSDVRCESGSKFFNVFWTAQVNVTGYEVEITHIEKGSADHAGRAWTLITDSNALSVTAFNGEELKNYDTYRIRVRSVNAEWRSDYSSSIDAVPMPTDKPAPPDNVVAVAGMGTIDVSWKKMKDTLSYTVYYEEKDQPSTRQSIAVNETHYTILPPSSDVKTYTVWVTGTNELGESAASLKSNVTTISIVPVQFPEYLLFTTPQKEGGTGVLSHIENAFWNTQDTRIKGMYSSSLDKGTAGSALGLADNDFGSYYHVEDWDDGCSYSGWDKGVTVKLTEKHEMNMLMFADILDNTYYNAALYYMDKEGKEVKAENVTVSSRVDSNGRRYHIIKLFDPITTDQVRICLERSGGARSIGIAEIRFYDYDPIEREVMDLFEDSMHLVLKNGVTIKKIQELRDRVNTAHPYRDLILSELDTAEKILKDADALKDVDVVTVAPTITARKDGHLGFSGLNSWQPLGITAYAGEELVIYVGHEGKNTGAATELQVVVTQYHAESTPFMQVISQKLKVGQNLVTVPEIASFDFERGGSVYIQYTGNNANDVYGVRVKGGQPIPVLNLYQVEAGSAEWLSRTETYVSELEKHVADQKKLHDKLHKGNAAATVNYEYDSKNCILGATEIMMDQMMLSVSGEQILKGLGGGSVQEKASKLSKSLQAMEEMMTLFYQHKGLSNAADAGANNKLPSQHLNIRYHRMFAGAFMYASGNHIGIEWDSVAGLTGGEPVVSDNGKYVSGGYFGWGIAHEIGHDINQGTYAIAEVTNNYFSVLAQAKETNESVRFSYEEVYDKVTSGATGRASNVFTQLGLYWQLHLAYDKGYNYKIYSNYKDQLNNLFFARVDTYARSAAAAPKTEIPLALYNLDGDGKTVNIDIDQKLMRLASAAAQKDLTDFFVRWGMVPDDATAAYMGQFEEEERAVYYVNDEARAYAIEHDSAMAEETVKGKDVVGNVTLSTDLTRPNQVTLSLANTAQYPDAVLGYEIARCSISGGKPEKKVVGFTTESTFVDTVSSINNRVFTYEVTVIDKFLNRSVAKALDPVKVSHDGSYDKTQWKVTTNMYSSDDVDANGTQEDPCDPEIESAITLTVDQNVDSVYTGETKSGDPSVILELNQIVGITALKYTAPEKDRITGYTVEISTNGNNWITVGTGTFQKKSGAEVVYFRNKKNDPWACTYDASYVRLTANGQGGKKISIGEIDLLGPTGDNVEFVTDVDSRPAFGYLGSDYVYDGEGNKIPKGSLVFVGQYKGNPAYNVVILYDSEGNIVGGTDPDGTLVASQVIMADVPEEGELGETNDGRFIYWIEPVAGEKPAAPGSVRAELYRVDNALNNEGQRLVSDTKLVKLPDNLPTITLSGSGE